MSLTRVPVAAKRKEKEAAAPGVSPRPPVAGQRGTERFRSHLIKIKSAETTVLLLRYRDA